MSDIISTSTDGIEDAQITEYIDMVAGEAIMGANVVSDIAAGIRDVVGGRSGSSEKRIDEGRKEAMADLREEARELGADAVVGAAFDYEEMAEGMLWVNVSGTAVRRRR